MQDKLLFLIILIFYVFLPIIIFCNVILFKYKFYILTIAGLLIYFILKIGKISNDKLGIRKENMLKSIKRNLPIIIILIMSVVVFKILNFDKYIPNESILFYLFYIFISCPIQEFLYRGVFGYFENNLIKNKFIISILSSFCYSFVHIIYRDFITCLLTFIFGIILYLLYRKDYNLFGVSITHIIIGILTIYLGIIN